jgi:hypothetical protein
LHPFVFGCKFCHCFQNLYTLNILLWPWQHRLLIHRPLTYSGHYGQQHILCIMWCFCKNLAIQTENHTNTRMQLDYTTCGVSQMCVMSHCYTTSQVGSSTSLRYSLSLSTVTLQISRKLVLLSGWVKTALKNRQSLQIISQNKHHIYKKWKVNCDL